MTAIEVHLSRGRRSLEAQAHAYLRWLADAQAGRVSARTMHEGYVMLRLRFNIVLSQFDLFSDVLSQRSEARLGVWLAGLDVAASEALSVPGNYFTPPPLVCYVDRGPGGAIRRARTRLPGGGENPIAIIRVPRERMIGAGVASSLVHEAGHQGAALLDLAASLRPLLQGLQKKGGSEQLAWRLWERWISEILADLWGVARVGVAATTGLMGVVSVPRPFQFRIDEGDPHPAPFIRVLLSAALGAQLYPDPQWRRLSALWESFYPISHSDPAEAGVIQLLRSTIPSLTALLLNHRPARLLGRALGEALASNDRQPHRLRALHRASRQQPKHLFGVAPTVALATVAQARADGRMTPERESQLLASLLTHWALENALGRSAQGAIQNKAQAAA